MVFGLGAAALLLLLAVSMCAFFVSMTMDSVIGERGFGVLGNMVILTAGFYIGLEGSVRLGLVLSDITMTTLAGMSGSFLALALLSFLKARLRLL
ncbi:MAG: hypothetical protein ACRECW_20150 [Phyllobacterium sp.]